MEGRPTHRVRRSHQHRDMEAATHPSPTAGQPHLPDTRTSLHRHRRPGRPRQTRSPWWHRRPHQPPERMSPMPLMEDRSGSPGRPRMNLRPIPLTGNHDEPAVCVVTRMGANDSRPFAMNEHVQAAARHRPLHPQWLSHLGQHRNSIGMQRSISTYHVVQVPTCQAISEHHSVRTVGNRRVVAPRLRVGRRRRAAIRPHRTLPIGTRPAAQPGQRLGNHAAGLPLTAPLTAHPRRPAAARPVEVPTTDPAPHTAIIPLTGAMSR